ncbi:MAG: hypothetical protein PHX27_04025 [Candidatus ainarchaeum sp.]|nr:hypothetical protein [Candidatus ainarchaeum sp.]
MVNDEIIDSTILRMLDAEIDDSTIISTLTDVGMSENDSRDRINKLRDSKNSELNKKINLEKDSSDEDVDSSNNENNYSNEYLSSDSNMDDDSDAKELGEITDQNDRNFNDDKIKEVDEKIEDLKKTVINTKVAPVNDSKLNEKLSDLSAQNNALMRIMKDVLEVNRKILTELESKK